MEKEIYYDLFISHKQINGGRLAMNIKLLLLKEKPNLDIFLDVDDLNNIHDLSSIVRRSLNMLLIITDGVFERPYIIQELKTALEYKINIIVVWNKEYCKDFPTKDSVPEDVQQVLLIKAIPWISEIDFRKIIIEKILNNIKIDHFFSYLDYESKMLIRCTRTQMKELLDKGYKDTIRSIEKYIGLNIDDKILEDFRLDMKKILFYMEI